MSTHLSGGKVNMSLVQSMARTNLLQLLEKCNGSKAIIWDDSLAGPVGLIAQFRLLSERDVTKMFHLKSGNLPPMHNISNVIFITRPMVKHMDIIADNIKRKEKEKRSDTRHIDYHLFFVPRKSLICEQRLQEKGVLGNFNLIESFSCNLFPFDSDLLSMEINLGYREYHLEKDPTCLYEVAEAIITLQKLYGIIPRVSGKGPCVQQVWDLVKRLSLEPNQNFNQCKSSQISQLILIDRNVDTLTPLVTQLTYEGLIDEIFGINNTIAQFPAAKFSQNEDEPNDIVPDKKQIVLNSGDELFVDLRDKIFTAVGPALSEKAKLISAKFDTQNYHEKSVPEMKQLVKQLPYLMNEKKLLATHTTIAELIKAVTDTSEFLDAVHTEQELLLGLDKDKALPYIENAIAHKKPLLKILKLICMQSFTNSGLKPKVLEYYKREIIQTYGFQNMLTLENLEQAGLLKCSSPSSGTTHQYSRLRKTLHLTVEGSNELAPSDINFVHSIYAPLSVRLVQDLSKAPNTIPQEFASLPGPILEETQSSSLRRSSSVSNNESGRVVLVFFIGGCTFAEISALRFLSQKEENPVEYIVATTKLINGESFVKSLLEPL